jgi:hypothetical protein
MWRHHCFVRFPSLPTRSRVLLRTPSYPYLVYGNHPQNVLLDFSVQAVESYIPTLNGLKRAPLISLAPPLYTLAPKRETTPS